MNSGEAPNRSDDLAAAPAMGFGENCGKLWISICSMKSDSQGATIRVFQAHDGLLVSLLLLGFKILYVWWINLLSIDERKPTY